MAFAALVVGAASCAKDRIVLPETANGEATLVFSCGDIQTKTAGVNNENKVNKIDWFIFPYAADGIQIDSTAAPLLNGTIEPAATARLDKSYTKTLNATELAEVFPEADSKAFVFAVANFTGAYPDTITLKKLLETEVRSTFADGDRWPHPLQTTDEPLYFVMTGSAELMLSSATEVQLARLASKVTVTFTYEESIPDAHDANLVWKPQYNGPEARVYLSNAIATATLGGPLTARDYIPDSSSSYTDGTRDIFEYSYDYLTALTGDPVYYTYPANLEAGDDNQPYLKLVLPWYAYDKRDNSEDAAPVKQKEVYYKIALPLDALKEGNRMYEYKVHVDIIGSDTEVEIGATYSVKDWFHDKAISSNLATGKYISLDIPKDEYNMYSNKVEILYIASGDVEISDLKIYQDDFSSTTSTVSDFITGKNGNNYTYGAGKSASTTDVAGHTLNNWVKTSNSKLVVEHQMNNDFSDQAFDAAPMYFVVTLHLVDAGTDITFDRKITITQYPSLYVTKQNHHGYVFVNSYGTISGNRPAWDNRGDKGMYNNYNQYADYFLGQVMDQDANLGTGANSNPNNYTVYVTMLDNNSSKWVISDPRDVEGPLDNIDVTKYRKTKKDASNIIAPSFKIASTYGAVVNFGNYSSSYAPISYENAVKRCASYQENGYPAGRWRIPTEAEMEFVIYLSDYGKIPSLFNGSYFASSGRYLSYEDESFNGFNEPTDDGYRVRCVYDVWYWGDERSEDCYTGTDASGNKLYNTWGGFHDK